MHVIDAGALAYAIIADTREPRIAASVSALKPYNLGVLVARNGDEALGLIRRFGPPVLLVVDLSLPSPDGFTVIGAARQGAGRTEVVAWSSQRGLREFAAHRLQGEHVRVLSGSATPDVVRRAIERALRKRGTPNAEPVDRVDDMMQALAARARSICRTAGAAVYVKAPGEDTFRTAVTWESDELMPDSPADLPRLFDLISRTGEALVLPDLSRQRVAGVPMLRLRESLRGLVAVPVAGEGGQTVGTLCVFDVRAFRFNGAEVEALKALGRAGLSDAAAPPQAPVQPPLPEAGGNGTAEPAPLPALRSQSPIAPAVLERRDGNLAVARELARVRREHRSLSVILFDVDPAGETAREPSKDVLSAVAETLSGAVRGSDLAIKWSREELLLVLAGLNASEARRVAERVRAAMQAGARYPVAVSGGVAELLAEDTFESVVARADQQTRLAKSRGHNRVS